jgi:hypothetical protein
MSNWKKALRQECQNFVPDRKEIIKKQLGIPLVEERSYPQKPKMIFSWRMVGIAVMFVFTLVMALTMRTPVAQANSLVTVDINPSIELEVNHQEVVVDLRAMNVDGALLLEEHLDSLIGTSIYETLSAIVQYAEEVGYFESAETVHIYAINQNKKSEERLKNLIATYFSQVSYSLPAPVAVNEDNEDLKNEAAEHDVSVGMMMLIERAMASNTELTIDEALTLSPKQLHEQAKQYDKNQIDEFVEKYEEQIASFRDQQQQAINGSSNEFVVEIIREKYQQQVNAYKNELREVIKNHGQVEDVVFEFDDEFNEDLPTPSEDDYEGQELLLMIVRIKTIISSHKGKISNRTLGYIQELYRQYQTQLTKVGPILRNSQKVAEFEAFYQEFLEKMNH